MVVNIMSFYSVFRQWHRVVVVVEIIACAELVGRVGMRKAVEVCSRRDAAYREHCREYGSVGLFAEKVDMRVVALLVGKERRAKSSLAKCRYYALLVV